MFSLYVMEFAGKATLMPADSSDPKFDLVCDKSLLAGTLMSLHFSGSLVGAFLTGQAADIVGRRPIAVACLGLMSVFGTAISFTSNFQLMLALRFLLGLVLPGNTTVGYNRAVEMFTPKTRIVGNMLNQYFWTFGVIMVAPIAFLLPNWRNFQLAVSLASLPLLPLHWFFTYESLRWLVQMGRLEKAEAILQSIAKSKNIKYDGNLHATKNNENIPLAAYGTAEDESAATPEKLDGKSSVPLVPRQGDGTQDEPPLENSKEERTHRKGVYTEKLATRYTILDLFKTRVLIKNTSIIFYLWFSTNIMYFGLIVYATSLTGNKYLNFFLLALVEAPVYCHDYFVAKRFGRKRPIAFFFLASAISCVLLAFLPNKTADGTDLAVLIVVVAMIGKFYVNAAYELTMLVGVEVFPTVLRNVGQGSSVTVGRIGSVIAPFITYLEDVASFLPMAIFALLSLVASVGVLFLPETKDRPLPETYEDGNKLARDVEGTP
ncbi:organic cation transporter protein-like isoform X2 [Acanthaster planci]|uniref:Organic cation transporter protein-like isoform X2 n=1 Tax=Acanthaster planci TaxID=133434 RepID=A0A8B7XHX3_ACAPL|nr:organic cation transporter protein-like isoform X2 [Acanthaster planci]